MLFKANLKALRLNLFILINLFILFQLTSCKENNASSFAVQNKINQKEHSDHIKVNKSLARYFKDQGVQGSIIIYDSAKRVFITNDSLDIYKETFPASTFKILNLLIALETKVIKSEQDVIKWTGKIPDTSLYGYRPDIYFDMSVRDAFTVSAGWVFAELAERIGEEKYRNYLHLCNYGNKKYSAEGFEFWNFGPLQVSPLNQVLFLRRMYKGALPFEKEHVEILKDIMISQKGPGYVIHSKTGWTRHEDTEIGWWVGYIETNDNVFFFATRITQPFNRMKSYDSKFGRYRKEITTNVFRHLRILN